MPTVEIDEATTKRVQAPASASKIRRVPWTFTSRQSASAPQPATAARCTAIELEALQFLEPGARREVPLTLDAGYVNLAASEAHDVRQRRRGLAQLTAEPARRSSDQKRFWPFLRGVLQVARLPINGLRGRTHAHRRSQTENRRQNAAFLPCRGEKNGFARPFRVLQPLGRFFACARTRHWASVVRGTTLAVLPCPDCCCSIAMAAARLISCWHSDARAAVMLRPAASPRRAAAPRRRSGIDPLLEADSQCVGGGAHRCAVSGAGAARLPRPHHLPKQRRRHPADTALAPGRRPRRAAM